LDTGWTLDASPYIEYRSDCTPGTEQSVFSDTTALAWDSQSTIGSLEKNQLCCRGMILILALRPRSGPGIKLLRATVEPALIGPVTFHRCAMQVPPKLCRTAVGQVNRAAIVPEDEVVVLPAMAVNETCCRAMGEKEFEQFPVFLVGEVKNPRREALVHE
jgi:hypothetical protein